MAREMSCGSVCDRWHRRTYGCAACLLWLEEHTNYPETAQLNDRTEQVRGGDTPELNSGLLNPCINCASTSVGRSTRAKPAIDGLNAKLDVLPKILRSDKHGLY